MGRGALCVGSLFGLFGLFGREREKQDWRDEWDGLSGLCGGEQEAREWRKGGKSETRVWSVSCV